MLRATKVVLAGLSTGIIVGNSGTSAAAEEKAGEGEGDSDVNSSCVECVGGDRSRFDAVEDECEDVEETPQPLWNDRVAVLLCDVVEGFARTCDAREDIGLSAVIDDKKTLRSGKHTRRDIRWLNAASRQRQGATRRDEEARNREGRARREADFVACGKLVKGHARACLPGRRGAAEKDRKAS